MEDLRASVRVQRVQPKFVDAAHGFAMFNGDSDVIAASATVLEEFPLVSCQYLEQRQPPISLQSCPHCLAFAGTLESEVKRLQSFLASPADDKLRRGITDAYMVIARFLDRLRKVTNEADPLPFAWFKSAAAAKNGGPVRCQGCGSDLSGLPSLDAIGRLGSSIGVATNDESLVALRIVMETGDERVGMIALLFHDAFVDRLPTITGSSSPKMPPAAVDVSCRLLAATARLDSFVNSFAMGPSKTVSMLNTSQQAVVTCAVEALVPLYRRACSCRRCKEAGDGAARSSFEDISPELIQKARQALDANIHTVMVTNPLWNFVQFSQSQLAGAPAADRAALEHLRDVFSRLTPKQLHNRGFAFFHLGSRFNHSCDPNTAFVPTPAPARFRAVSLVDIAPGAEATIAYIDVGMTAEERTKPLMAQYGFRCDCRRCVTADIT
jgi:hypothetical protein